MAWEIELKPGVNSLGRGFANDFKVADPSVSNSHCEIMVEGPTVRIRDLGSTNGTFVNRSPVKEAVLNPGQTVHLGSVEMLYSVNGPAAAAPPPPPLPIGGLPPRIVSTTSIPTAAIAGHTCKSHPKTAARHRCPQCGHYFCDLCITSRTTGATPGKFCRQCGAMCLPVAVAPVAAPAGEKTFFALLPGAFLYPVRGSGVMVLLAAALIFGLLNMIAPMRFGIIPQYFGWGLMGQVFAMGYLFAFMQSIIHAAAIGEEEMPPLPSASSAWSDIVLPCLQLIGLTLICFSPVIAVTVWAASSGEPPPVLLLVSAFALGCLYFPMAFLAVAMLDTLMAANPLQVVPSILKVPGQYLVAVALAAIVLGLRPIGDGVLTAVFPRKIYTHSMGEMVAYLASVGFWYVGSLYLLTVSMRILGLLFRANRERLGWLEQ